jgi:hypothetical protein
MISEISNNLWTTYQFGKEPELVHIYKHRDNEYLVAYSDAYDLSTGKCEVLNKLDIESKFNIKID